MKDINITISYNEETKEASVTLGSNNYGTCETCTQVCDAIVKATHDIMNALFADGMKP